MAGSRKQALVGVRRGYDSSLLMGLQRGPDFQVPWPLMTGRLGLLYVPNTEWNMWLSSRHPGASGGALSVAKQGVAVGTRLDGF